MVAQLRLSRFAFFAGPRPGDPPLTVDLSTVVVFVGPNNSGKSLALREIEQWCVVREQLRKVIEHIEAAFPDTEDDAIELLNGFRTPPPRGQIESPGMMWLGQHTFRTEEPVLHFQLNPQDVRSAVEQRIVDHLRSYLLRLYTIRLDGRTRFLLSDPKPSGDLQLPPQNHLWALFQNEDARRRVRELTHDAFGLQFVVDPTAMTQFRIRMSRRTPQDGSEEQALDARARAFHAEAPLVSELSDGVQAFTGLVSAVMSLSHRVMLIDEPEAFLHPSLARRLARILAGLATERGGNLVAATHSADFLMGCLETTPDTTIVRLTFEDDVATARALAAADLKTLMLDPLLRSTGALNGLFHRAVVVTEADADRAFYDEVNRRLQEEGRGIPDARFLNAQNWQTVPRVMAPLRRLGIPAAAVIDLDTICVPNPWEAFYEAAGLDAATRGALDTRRGTAARHLSAVGAQDYKERGIRTLRRRERVEVQSFLDELARLGIFVVPAGELESWLPGLGVPRGRKRDWIIGMFARLGSDPALPNYVPPAHDDVWNFLDTMSGWFATPAREGIP